MIGSDGSVRRELGASTHKHSCTEYLTVHQCFLQPNDPCDLHESLDYQVAERTARCQMRLAVPGPAQASILLSSLDAFQRSVAERWIRLLNHSGDGKNVSDLLTAAGPGAAGLERQ